MKRKWSFFEKQKHEDEEKRVSRQESAKKEKENYEKKEPSRKKKKITPIQKKSQRCMTPPPSKKQIFCRKKSSTPKLNPPIQETNHFISPIKQIKFRDKFSSSKKFTPMANRKKLSFSSSKKPLFRKKKKLKHSLKIKFSQEKEKFISESNILSQESDCQYLIDLVNEESSLSQESDSIDLLNEESSQNNSNDLLNKISKKKIKIKNFHNLNQTEIQIKNKQILVNTSEINTEKLNLIHEIKMQNDANKYKTCKHLITQEGDQIFNKNAVRIECCNCKKFIKFKPQTNLEEPIINFGIYHKGSRFIDLDLHDLNWLKDTVCRCNYTKKKNILEKINYAIVKVSICNNLNKKKKKLKNKTNLKKKVSNYAKRRDDFNSKFIFSTPVRTPIKQMKKKELNTKTIFTSSRFSNKRIPAEIYPKIEDLRGVIFYDLETVCTNENSGFDTTQTYILEFACSDIFGNCLNCRCNPGPNISWEDLPEQNKTFYKENHFDEIMKHQNYLRSFSDEWKEVILPWLRAHKFPEVLMVAHNGKRFDSVVMKKEFERNGFLDDEYLQIHFADSLIWFRETWQRGNAKLTNLMRDIVGKKFEAHSALEDVKALLIIFKHFGPVRKKCWEELKQILKN